MDQLTGKWVQGLDQPYPGLYFDFSANGTFHAEMASMGVESSGTWSVDGNQITINQDTHTFGLTGVFEGLFQIEGNTLRMALSSGTGSPRPATLDEARIYIKDEG